MKTEFYQIQFINHTMSELAMNNKPTPGAIWEEQGEVILFVQHPEGAPRPVLVLANRKQDGALSPRLLMTKCCVHDSMTELQAGKIDASYFLDSYKWISEAITKAGLLYDVDGKMCLDTAFEPELKDD
jgi:hypothetical protein